MKTWKKLLIAGILLAPLTIWFVTRESPEHKIDREVGWKDVKPYYTTTHGVEVGQVTVPGHTQRVTFYMWGIPKEAYIDENEEPKIIGEMNVSVTPSTPVRWRAFLLD